MRATCYGFHPKCLCRKRQQLPRLWALRCWTSPGLVCRSAVQAPRRAWGNKKDAPWSSQSDMPLAQAVAVRSLFYKEAQNEGTYYHKCSCSYSILFWSCFTDIVSVSVMCTAYMLKCAAVISSNIRLPTDQVVPATTLRLKTQPPQQLPAR